MKPTTVIMSTRLPITDIAALMKLYPTKTRSQILRSLFDQIISLLKAEGRLETLTEMEAVTILYKDSQPGDGTSKLMTRVANATYGGQREKSSKEDITAAEAALLGE